MYSVWAITGSGKVIIAKGFVLLLASIPVYVGMKGWQKHEAVPDSAALRVPPPAKRVAAARTAVGVSTMEGHR